MSHTLGSLEVDLVTTVDVVELNLTALCESESLGRSLMCLNLSPLIFPFPDDIS